MILLTALILILVNESLEFPYSNDETDQLLSQLDGLVHSLIRQKREARAVYRAAPAVASSPAGSADSADISSDGVGIAVSGYPGVSVGGSPGFSGPGMASGTDMMAMPAMPAGGCAGMPVSTMETSYAGSSAVGGRRQGEGGGRRGDSGGGSGRGGTGSGSGTGGRTRGSGGSQRMPGQQMTMKMPQQK